MILLISEYNDNSTVYVSQWLIHWNVPFIRIDQEDNFSLEVISINNGLVDFVIKRNDGSIIKSSEISAVWYRRGEMSLNTPNLDFMSQEKLRKSVARYLAMENGVLERFFYYLMHEKPHIGSFHKRVVNKLVVLREASKLGISIPKTIVTNQKNNNLGDDFIYKSLYEGFKFEYDKKKYTTYTEKVSFSTAKDGFFPTLFQEEIKKEADIRVFYLLGEFYCMAIRSQAHAQTKTDFRKYLRGNGNRLFPFELPKEEASKLDNLMKKLGLETGSIDLILTECGDFVFLEVNPVGQFGMTSFPCNYYLEKRIASKLVKMAKLQSL